MEGEAITALQTNLLHLENQITTLLEHVQREEFKSYDYYDLWATELGQRAKQWSYRTEPAGHLFFSLPLLVCEIWLPFLRKPLGIKKRIYPISVAHHGLACLELYKYSRDEDWLQNAKNDAELLIRLAISGAKGLCWGFPFVWSTNMGIIPSNQPAATQTSYGFDLFEQLWNITGDETYRTRLLAVARAMDEEYIDIPYHSGLAHTYHGRGYGDVIANAISYRMRILAGAASYGAPQYAEKAKKLALYLLEIQRPDGSWLYGQTLKNQFIDHYHTCFVIKNLYRTNLVLNIPEISSAVERGINYYWENLFDKYGLPQPFARQIRSNIVKRESYDFAECLGLFALFGVQYGFTHSRLELILNYLLQDFVLSDHALRFRIYHFPSARGYPYFRFGMTAAILSMAKLLNSPFMHNG